MAELESTFDGAPVNRHLGFRLVEASPDGATVAAPASRDFQQETGVVHGGLLATLADTAAVYTLWPTLEEGSSMTSIEFKLNFLRPARVGAGELVARASCVQRGRKVALCDVEVEQDGRAVARGLFTYLFLRG